MVRYSNKKEVIHDLDVSGFFEGWPNHPDDETLKKILCNSQFIQMAIVDVKLVGFINAISDLILTAYIPLLEVLPEYQGQGIGQKLVTKMKEQLQNFYMIDICCDQDIISFYEKLSFNQGYSMSLRNYQNQAGFIK